MPAFKATRKFGTGAGGIAAVLIAAAAAGLGAPPVVWIVFGLVGIGVLIYAFAVGEPEAPESGAAPPSVPSQKAEGGSGEGDFRGNVIHRSTVNFHKAGDPPDPLAGRDRADATPKDLMKLYRDHTKVNAVRLADPYLGSWLRLKVRIFDVDDHPVHEGKFRVTADFGEDENSLVFLDFSDKAQFRLPQLKREQMVEVIGCIKGIAATTLDLDECEFVD